MDESKYVINAYQKKTIELFNQTILLDSKVQQITDLASSYKEKIDELVQTNQQLVQEIENLRTHVREREDQIENLSKSSTLKRTRKKISTPENIEVRDGGTF